jgi:hypothetical protein
MSESSVDHSTMEPLMTKKKLSFPKSKIKIVLLENCHSVAVEAFKKEGFQVEVHKGE